MVNNTSKMNAWKLIFLIILGLVVVSVFLAISIDSQLQRVSGGSQIAVIPIEGPITLKGDEIIPFQKGGASSAKIVENIQKADESKSVSAIILHINSPGGTVVASSNIADAISQTEKPTVAFIQEVGASGAYWAASATDYIVAEPLSITGSIGVIGSYLEFSELFENYGINYQRLVSGEFKDVGSPFRALTPTEENLLQQKLNIIHEEFISQVASNRGLSKDQVKGLATGIYYLGREAADLELVDELGSFDVAKRKAEELAGLEESTIVRYEEAEKFDILDLIVRTSGYYIGQGIGASLLQSSEDKPIDFIT